MSSWFSFFSSASSQDPNLDENSDQITPDIQPGTSGSSDTENQLRSTTSMLRDFPEDQRRHIRDVLKRAEQSKTQARLVVDSDVLEHVRQKQAQRDSISDSFDDADEELNEDFLQMEALPDGSFSKQSDKLNRYSNRSHNWSESRSISFSYVGHKHCRF
jgi:hypothetical protein